MSQATASMSSATGLFDLPLELRQIIYRECLPRNQLNEFTIFMDPERPEDKTLTALRNSDPRILLEIQNEERLLCKSLLFRVSATKRWQPPPSTTSYPNLTYLNITYVQHPYTAPPKAHHEECNCGYDRISRRIREDYLTTMFWNLRNFVIWFKEAHDKPIDELEVCFEEKESCPSDEIPSCWCCSSSDVFEDEIEIKFEDSPWCKTHYNVRGKPVAYTLATRQANGKTVAVLESLLRPLANLPVAKDVYIESPDCFFDLSINFELRDAGLKSRFGSSYYHCVYKTWEEWLGGKRNISVQKLFRQKLGAECWCPDVPHKDKADCKRCW